MALFLLPSCSNILFEVESGKNNTLRFVPFRTNHPGLFAIEMQAKSPDKRVKRTRQALAEALLVLTMEKGYDNVTVQHILDHTGIGRSTFYSHFRDKDDLLLSNLANLRSGLFSNWESMIRSKATSRGQFGFLLPFLKHLDQARGLHRALTRGESGPITARTLQRILADLIRADIAEYASGRWSGPRLDAVIQLIAGGLMSLLTWWLDNKVDLSPEDLDRIFRHIALNGLKSDLSDAKS